MPRLSTTLSLFTLFLTAACSGADGAPGSSDPAPAASSNTAAELEAIKAQSVRFSQAYVNGDLDAQMAIYASDAVIAPPGRDFIQGMEGLRSYWTTPAGREVVSHSTTPVDIVISGDLAYDWGSYQGASGPIGSESEFAGKYLIVWQRGEDGVWRMVQDMWNASR